MKGWVLAVVVACLASSVYGSTQITPTVSGGVLSFTWISDAEIEGVYVRWQGQQVYSASLNPTRTYGTVSGVDLDSPAAGTYRLQVFLDPVGYGASIEWATDIEIDGSGGVDPGNGDLTGECGCPAAEVSAGAAVLVEAVCCQWVCSLKRLIYAAAGPVGGILMFCFAAWWAVFVLWRWVHSLEGAEGEDHDDDEE